MESVLLVPMVRGGGPVSVLIRISCLCEFTQKERFVSHSCVTDRPPPFYRLTILWVSILGWAPPGRACGCNRPAVGSCLLHVSSQRPSLGGAGGMGGAPGWGPVTSLPPCSACGVSRKPTRPVSEGPAARFVKGGSEHGRWGYGGDIATCHVCGGLHWLSFASFRKFSGFLCTDFMSSEACDLVFCHFLLQTCTGSSLLCLLFWCVHGAMG